MTSIFTFVWQAWHLLTSTFTLCGQCGTYGTGLALVARQGPVWRRCRRGCLCGRRCTWRHGPALYVAGVALGDIDLHFVWQLADIQCHLAWHALGDMELHFPRNTSTHNTFTPTPVPTPSSHTTLSPTALSHTTLSHTHTTFTHHAFYTHFFHQQHFYTELDSFTHLTSTCISCTHRSSTISFLFPAFPIPSSPFFGYFLEEVDKWGSAGPLIFYIFVGPTVSWCPVNHWPIWAIVDEHTISSGGHGICGCLKKTKNRV